MLLFLVKSYLSNNFQGYTGFCDAVKLLGSSRQAIGEAQKVAFELPVSQKSPSLGFFLGVFRVFGG
jgi:hypothetical protein